MKNPIHILIAAVVVALPACVDDYTDANPRQRLDAPTLRVSTPAAANNLLVSNPVNAFQFQPEVFMTYSEPLAFTVAVIDAPGGIGDVTVTSSIPEYGALTLDDASVAAIQTQQNGTFNFTFMPVADFADESDRTFNIDVTVFDNQVGEDGGANPKNTTLTIPVTLSKCLSSGIQPGYYTLSELTAQEDGGDAITIDSLEKYLGERVAINISRERPGLYEIDDVTAGVWPVYYPGRALPTVQLDLCGNTISGHDGAVSTGVGTAAARTFTINGIANDDGTITIDWTYVRDDGTTPPDPAKGSYTLTPL